MKAYLDPEIRCLHTYVSVFNCYRQSQPLELCLPPFPLKQPSSAFCKLPIERPDRRQYQVGRSYIPCHRWLQWHTERSGILTTDSIVEMVSTFTFRLRYLLCIWSTILLLRLDSSWSYWDRKHRWLCRFLRSLDPELFWWCSSSFDACWFRFDSLHLLHTDSEKIPFYLVVA